jgi:hypothetical protein
MAWKELGTFKISGKDVKLSVLTGDVVDTSQQTATHVTGNVRVASDPGGHVSGSGEMSSTVVVTRDVFLRDEGGKEHELAFRSFNNGIRLRAGHKVSVFGVESALVPAHAGGTRVPYMMYNHTTSTQSRVVPVDILGGMKTGLIWAAAVALVLLVALIGSGYSQPEVLFGAVFFLGAPLLLVGAVYGALVLSPSRMRRLANEYRRLAQPIIGT